MLTQHAPAGLVRPIREAVRASIRVMEPEQVEAVGAHSRWEIAALLGTLLLLIPFGLLIVIGL
jgi:hypothetical protein